MASVPFTSLPISHHCRFDSQPFRVLLPSTARTCRCGLPLDPCGHHRAAFSVAGVLGRRGFAVESAAARVCREAGARVSLNVRVQDMDLALPDALDNRCLEIVADGLPLFQGAQLAVDTTLVSVLRRDGVPRQRSTTQPRSCFDDRPPSEGAGLPRAHKPEGPHTACGPGVGSGRPVVRGMP